MSAIQAPPEHNVTGIDYAERGHFRHAGPIIDFHTHVMTTSASDPKNAPRLQVAPDASVEQARIMLEAAEDFGIEQTVTMCLPDEIPVLREAFGSHLLFNGMINKKRIDEPDDDAYRLLDRFLENGVKIIKFWAAPRGRERGLLVDTPWRIESVKRARAAGVRLFMVHVGDPDSWFRGVYADASKFGTKADQYTGLVRMLEMFPDVLWIGAHMGGDPEHPDHLEELLEKYPHFHIDTSATKWQVREVSRRPEAIRNLVIKYPQRFLFGTDLVTRHGLQREHYVSRYWCQRTLWESAWKGPSPIQDPDYAPLEGEPALPLLHGLSLPADVVKRLYFDNAKDLLH